MPANYVDLNVNDISFDTDNPRIKMALKKYGDQLTPDRIHFALRSATEGGTGASSYNSLRDSIRASRGIITPITVNSINDKLVCVDGNTRLAIYKHFIKTNELGDWSHIKSILISNADEKDIEAIRVSKHLVGAREWPAYEKARYLHYLRSRQFMDYNQMIALCGGNRTDIERQIDAYHDMNEYYRDIVDDTAFHIDRFSGFVELQKPRIKEAIFGAGLNLGDFGRWIRDGQIYRLRDVRELPNVLVDEDAKQAFLSGGPRSIEEAVRILVQKSEQPEEQPEEEVTLANATIHQLATVLAQRINDLTYGELLDFRDRERADIARQLTGVETLAGRLQDFLEDVSE